MKDAGFQLKELSNTIMISCYGEWRVDTLDKIEQDIYALKSLLNPVVIDMSSLSALDTSGALLLAVLEAQCKAGFTYKNITHKQERLIEIIKRGTQKQETVKHKRVSDIQRFAYKIYTLYDYQKAFVAFLGELFIKTLHVFADLRKFRIKESIYFVQSSGINALMIIGVTAFLVGVVIAYQTIVQLTKFGADIFVVDTSAIAITRELGPMITAIVVAGRSASSYTAEIGAMKLTDEIDAMKTMGFMPFYFLVIPRIVALVISLPLLIFFSDIVGIFGAMIVAKVQIGLSFDIFVQRVYEVLDLKHYLIGIFKGPFFALIIAVTGVFHGLKVSQDTESIGRETTSSVVNAIFFVIVCDTLFSVIFTELGI